MSAAGTAERAAPYSGPKPGPASAAAKALASVPGARCADAAGTGPGASGGVSMEAMLPPCCRGVAGSCCGDWCCVPPVALGGGLWAAGPVGPAVLAEGAAMGLPSEKQGALPSSWEGAPSWGGLPTAGSRVGVLGGVEDQRAGTEASGVGPTGDSQRQCSKQLVHSAPPAHPRQRARRVHPQRRRAASAAPPPGAAGRCRRCCGGPERQVEGAAPMLRWRHPGWGRVTVGTAGCGHPTWPAQQTAGGC